MEQEHEEDHDDNEEEEVEAPEESLYDLAYRKDLDGTLARLNELARQDTVRELLYCNEHGVTALHLVLASDSSIELVTAIWDVMKDDPLKTNIFAIADRHGQYPLHHCVATTTRVEVLNFVIGKFPHALVRRRNENRTTLVIAQGNSHRANHAAILRCLEERTAKYPSLLNQITAKCCLVTMKRNGMTAYVARTPLNDLTQPQFVFMVLDMMKNCAMQPLAEEVISYVGTSVRLLSELDVAKVELKRQINQVVSEVKQQVSEVKQQVSEAAQQQQVAQLDARMSRLEQAMAEQEASRKRDLAEQEASRRRDHDAVMASNAALMAALAAIRGLPADQEGDGGDLSRKRKENGA